MNANERDLYLQRIGYTEKTTADRACLETLMELQLRSIPFENLEPYEEGKVPSLDSGDLYRKIVVRKRGGYCFELNKLFYELLKTIGFQVIPIGVRILWNKEKLPPMLHRATLVKLEDGIYYCDVGYGGPGPKSPVKLEDGIYEEKGGSFRITMHPEGTAGEILVERKKAEAYLPLLRFSLRAAVEEDFEPMNFYCAKSPDTVFTQKRVLSRNTAGGSVALTGNTLTILQADGTLKSLEGKTEDLIKEWIETYFGIQV